MLGICFGFAENIIQQHLHYNSDPVAPAVLKTPADLALAAMPPRRVLGPPLQGTHYHPERLPARPHYHPRRLPARTHYHPRSLPARRTHYHPRRLPARRYNENKQRFRPIILSKRT